MQVARSDVFCPCVWAHLSSCAVIIDIKYSFLRWGVDFKRIPVACNADAVCGGVHDEWWKTNLICESHRDLRRKHRCINNIALKLSAPFGPCGKVMIAHNVGEPGRWTPEDNAKASSNILLPFFRCCVYKLMCGVAIGVCCFHLPCCCSLWYCNIFGEVSL